MMQVPWGGEVAGSNPAAPARHSPLRRLTRLVNTSPMDLRRRPALVLTLGGAAAMLMATGALATPEDPTYVRIVGNQSSRDGAVPELIVIHATTDPRSTSGPVVRDQPGLR